jgi:hypothetical protein
MCEFELYRFCDRLTLCWPNGDVQPLAGVIPVSLAAASSGESAGTEVRRAPRRTPALPPAAVTQTQRVRVLRVVRVIRVPCCPAAQL